jgi:hypothetical protein
MNNKPKRWLWLPLPVLVLLLSVSALFPTLSYAVGQDYTVNSVVETGLTLFKAEEQAQKHCPQDTVVWLNLPSGIYHYKGQRWYARRDWSSVRILTRRRPIAIRRVEPFRVSNSSPLTGHSSALQLNALPCGFRTSNWASAQRRTPLPSGRITSYLP